VNSPDDLSAKPGILVVCLHLTRTFQGHAAHEDQASGLA
jgi:hypothetical protein